MARSRVLVLEQYVQGVAGSQEDAVQAAHRLSGALGSFARGGSDEAARLERLLADGPRDAPEVAPLVQALRAVVGTS
ncbi:MAG: hypothetical protein JWN17_356 [Frankiales bacterium]|nr:hypothetical protein [Frankiales bacterium]